MTRTQTDLSNETDAPRRRLPSPGCLLAAVLLAAIIPVVGCITWRVHRQTSNLNHFRRLGGLVETTPVLPVRLHNYLATMLGDDRARSCSDITSIYLADRKVADADLQPVRDLAKLEKLWLSNTQITDAGLENVSNLSNLVWLDLNYTHVSDDGLQHLSDLTNLRELRLQYTRVTDAGLEHLNGLANLRKLSLGGTEVTDAAIDELKSQLPGLEIFK